MSKVVRISQFAPAPQFKLSVPVKRRGKQRPKTCRIQQKPVNREQWLETHKEFLRWKKTPDYAKWRHAQFLKQGGTCWYCDEPLNGARQNIDHVIPKILGGGNHRANLVLACARCNKEKYSKLLPVSERTELKKKNRKKRGTYLQLKEHYKSEVDLALELKTMFPEDL